MTRAPRKPRSPLTAQQRVLVATWLPLVKRICAQFVLQNHAQHFAADLGGVAESALENYAAAYDVSTGVPFDTYLWTPVLWRLRDALAAEMEHWPADRIPWSDAGDHVIDESDVLNDSDETTIAHVDEAVDIILAGDVLTLKGNIARSGVASPPAYAVLFATLETALATLDPGDPQLLELRFVDGMKWDAVVAASGIPDRSARRRVPKALARVGRQLRVRRRMGGGMR